MAGNDRLPVLGPHGDNHTLIRLHEERMGRTEKRLEAVADDVTACLGKTDQAINALRREFVDQLTELREEIRRRPNEVILYIVVGAVLVLGGEGIRAIVGALVP